MTRSTSDVLHDHLLHRLRGDTDADIATNYAEDVIVLSSFGVFERHEGVARSAKLLLDQLGPSHFRYDRTAVRGEFAFLEWSAHSDDRAVSDGADSFVIRDGLIVLQTVHYGVRPES